MKDYVSVIYAEEKKPRTEYPVMLAKYLAERFSLKPGMKLLELGCGRGEFLEAFQGAGLIGHGVDLSDYCAKTKSHLHVKCLDVMNENLPYPDNSFDVVYHKSFIEHFYSPDRIMRETFRVLKPGGQVIILTPNWPSHIKTFYEDFTHCRPYTLKSLRDAMTIYGLCDVNTQTFCQYPGIWRSPLLRGISRLMQGFVPVPVARKITEITKIKYFRWSVELMILGVGKKPLTTIEK